MDDRLALARAVGVFDGPSHYQHQLALLDMREEQRRARRDMIGNLAAGVLLSCVLGIYVVLSFTMGAHA